MINIELSNHTGDQNEAVKSEREQTFQAQLNAYASALGARTAYSQELSQKARAAFSDGRYLSWALALLRLVVHFFRNRPEPPAGISVSEEEKVWKAGCEGEHRVREYLSCRLDDQYTLFDGYRNRGGEIDLLLVGPTGLLAIEVKYMNGLIHCNGDAWRRDRFDRYGNAVEVDAPITDRGGRGPSRQVNDAANQLEAFLASQSQSHPCPVRRAVIFCHDHSTLGTIHKPTVDCVSLLKDWDVVAFLSGTADSLDPVKLTSTEVFQLTKLVQRDHRFHNRPGKTQNLRSAVSQPSVPNAQARSRADCPRTSFSQARAAGNKE